MIRLATSVLLALALLAPLSACGKRSSTLEPPPDSSYPRSYPPR